jgi:hypothetical protein
MCYANDSNVIVRLMRNELSPYPQKHRRLPDWNQE